MGFAHEHHHEKDGVGLKPEDDFLLSLCFCPACLDRAARAGVDGAAAQRLVRAWITEACERPVPEPRLPDFPAGGPDSFRPWPALHAYVLWRFEPVTSLVTELRAATAPATRLVVIDLKHGWLGGCDPVALGKICDGTLLCAYDMTPDAVTDLMTNGRATLDAGKFLGAGFRLFHPEMSGPEALASRVAAAVAAGADGLNFYNYGLVPAARLDWVREALAGANGAAPTQTERT